MLPVRAPAGIVGIAVGSGWRTVPSALDLPPQRRANVPMRVAVAQTPGAPLQQWASTLRLIDTLIEQSAGQQADLVVLPECVWPTYCLGDPTAYEAARRTGLPGPQFFLHHLSRLADRWHMAVCAGYVDEADGKLRNAACLIGRDGRLLGVRHKCFLWGFDRAVFAAGDVIAPVDTPFGRVGLLICADARLPEIPATLAARGARLLLQPTAWVNCGTADRPWNPQPDFLIAARALEFGIPIASASKWGRELNTDFVGSSLICDHTGQVRVRCGPAETAVLVADVTPQEPRPPRVTSAERQALLSSAACTLPARDVAPLDISILPAGNSAQSGRVARRSRLAVQLRPARDCEVGQSGQAAGGITIDAPTAAVEVGGVRVAALDSQWLLSFAPLRVLALSGVHVAIVLGDGAMTDQSRLLAATRACENRLFLIYLGPTEWCVFDPGGRVIHAEPCADGPPAGRTLRLAAQLAADKEVAQDTNVLAGRCPRSYEF